MLAVPVVTPVTAPEPIPAVAIAVLLLDHVPPPVLLSEVVRPMHIFVLPEIGAGSGLTVTGMVDAQPLTT